MSRSGRDTLVACPDCDALQREPATALEHGCACWRCGAYLGPTVDGHPDRVLVLSLTALVTFAITLASPLASINVQGNVSRATLMDATRALWSDGMQPVALLVFFTTILVPAIDLIALVYLLGGLFLFERGWLARTPRFATQSLRMSQAARSWSLLEVFALGMLVALARLSRNGSIQIGIGFFSCAVLILLVAGLESTIHPRALWARLGRQVEDA